MVFQHVHWHGLTTATWVAAVVLLIVRDGLYFAWKLWMEGR